MMRNASLIVVLTVALVSGCVSLKPEYWVPERGADTSTLVDSAWLNIDSLIDHPTGKAGLVSTDTTAQGSESVADQHYPFDDGVVIADLAGPGTVTRVWSDNPWGLVAVYIDNDEEPVFTVPFNLLFESFRDVFGAPLAGAGAGGYYSYIPIPYQERCVIALFGPEEDGHHEVSYTSYAPGTAVQSFALPLEGSAEESFKQWRRTWSVAPGIRVHNLDGEKLHPSSRKLQPNEAPLIFSANGPGLIREIELSLNTKDPEKLRDVWLAVYFDGFTKPFVLAPVADFFGCGVPPADDLEGLAIGKADNRMWCRYPMPFASYAAIRLFNASHLAMDLAYNVTYVEGLSGDMTYFHARYNEAQTVMNEPYLAGRIHGTGHLVGASLAVHGATTFDFLEGGADVIVDKDYAGALRSMSTAAFFNCGLGLEGAPASSPCHGCSAKKTSYPVACSLYRGFLVDPIPFNQSVEVRFAHGNWNNKPGLTYASVLYWYQDEPNLEPWEMPRLTMSVER